MVREVYQVSISLVDLMTVSEEPIVRECYQLQVTSEQGDKNISISTCQQQAANK